MQVFRTNAMLTTAAVAVIFKNSSYLKNFLHFVLQPFVLLYKNFVRLCMLDISCIITILH